MPLRAAKADIIISEGLNENIHPKLLPQGLLRTVDDGILDKQGVSIKRPGFMPDAMTQLTAPPPYSTVGIQNIARFLSAPGDEVAFLDDRRAWSRSEEATAWSPRGEWGSWKGERIEFGAGSVGEVTHSDVAVANGYTCSVYRMAGEGGDYEIFATITELATGAILKAHERVFGGFGVNMGPPRIIVVGTRFIAVALQAGVGYKASFLSTATPASTSWDTPTLLVAAVFELGFDICAIGTSFFCLAQYDVGIVAFRVFDTAYVQQAVTSVPTAVPTVYRGVALHYDGSGIHTAYYRRNGASVDIEYVEFSTALATLGAVTIATGVTMANPEEARIAVCHDTLTDRAIVAYGHAYGANDQSGMSWQGVDTVGYALLGASHDLIWHFPTSQIVVHGDQFVMLVSTTAFFLEWARDHPTPLRDYAPLVDGIFALRIDPVLLDQALALGWYVGSYAAGEGIGVLGRIVGGVGEYPPTPALTLYEGSYYVSQAMVTGFRIPGTVAGGAGHTDPICTASVLKLSPSAAERGASLVVAGQTLVLGGIPGVYDGTVVSELATAWRPNILDIDEGAPGSGGYNPGGTNPTYFFRCAVKWTDRVGNVFWSEMSDIVSFECQNVNSKLTIYMQAPSLTNHGIWSPSPYRQPQLVVFRGTANDSQAFRRIPPSGTAGADISLELFPTDWYSIDSAGEITADLSGELAPDTGETSNTQIPSASVGCVANGRVMLRLDERKSRVAYSKPFIGARPPEFSYKTQYLDFPAELEALASMDGRFYAFARHGVYPVDGSGPARNLQQGTFSISEGPLGIGTTQPMGVISTPIGIMFPNELGFWLLNRGGQVEPLLGCRDTLQAYPQVLEAKMDPEHNAVRFLCSSGAEAVVLCFNWARRVWYVHRPTIGGVPMTMGYLDSKFWLAAGNVAYYESGYRDGAEQAFYPMRVRTGPFRCDDALEGFGRLWYVVPSCVRKDSHGLKVTLRYDPNGDHYSEHEFPKERTTLGGVNESPRVHVATGGQTSNYYDIEIEDTEDLASPGQGYELNGFTLEYGVKEGVAKKIGNELKG